MPKQILKIDMFHGGLNSSSDPRDIAPNELSDATDIMVDRLGKIRLIGSVTADDDAVPAASGAITPGYGLFQFSHDRLGGESSAANTATTGDDYYACSDADVTGKVRVYSRASGANGSWGSVIGDMGSNAGGTRKDVFYYADGALRISDGRLKNQNRPQWYGYINRYIFGDGSHGFSAGSFWNSGREESEWVHTDAYPEKLALDGGTFKFSASAHDVYSTEPIDILIETKPKDANYEIWDHADAKANSNTDTIALDCIFTAPSSGQIVTVSNDHGGSLTPNLASFCTPGDSIFIYQDHQGSSDNPGQFTDGVYTVSAVSDNNESPNTIEFLEDIFNNTTGQLYTAGSQLFYFINLSKGDWFDPENPGWQLAVSTLYDDSKQESALYIAGGSDTPTTMRPVDFLNPRLNRYSWFDDHNLYDKDDTQQDGFNKLRITFFGYVGNIQYDNQGIFNSYPRVSGWKVYMRRENTTTWYLQTEIDISKGSKKQDGGEYNHWDELENNPEWDQAAFTVGEYLESPREVETYESETGYSAEIKSVGFDTADTGFAAAVVANRTAYVGNVRILSGNQRKTFGDAILKSDVGKFDSFSIDRRLEVEIRDGDEIVQLEEYADRLLVFKKKKMHLLNISQEVEFLEDTFMHKGVLIPAATCKTDYGVAWVNRQGCYLYDGQKVTNLLEKQGRQIIKDFSSGDSDSWEEFTTDNSIIGYMPRKRQLIVLKDCTNASYGDIYLFDIVTQSWVKGNSAFTGQQYHTNFVTDWNGNLTFAHTTNTATIEMWNDTSAVSSKVSLMTKDIDFGEPGLRKKIYKVYLTYRGNATNVQVHYGVDGISPSSTFYTITSGTDGSSTGGTADAKCIPHDAGVDNWLKAELIPSGGINNISSFRLKISGDNSNTIHADFEINDISIVYRLKPVR